MKPSKSANRGPQVLLATLVILIVSFVLLIQWSFRVPDSGKELTIDQVERLASSGRIIEAKLLDQDAVVVGTRCLGQISRPATTSIENRPSCRGETEKFHSSYPRSDVGTQQLIERIGQQAPVSIDKQTGKAVAKMLITFVFPLLLLANLFGLIFMSRGDSSLADIAGFGRMGRQRQRRRFTGTGVTFAEVAGAEDAVTELREVTDYLTDPEKYEAYGASVPKGVLLFGPPGCGKTLMARAAAGESEVPFFSISGAEFVESLVGVGAARVRDLFRQVRDVAPAIVFIDEIDAVGRRRSGEGMTGGEREQTVNQLLVEMDGFEASEGIVVMGATNRPDILDPALLRPGRFDRHVTIQAPDVHGRQAILELHGSRRPLSAGVDFEYLARRTPGFTGADLANVVNEASLLAIRESTPEIGMEHLTEAIQRVMHGPSRRGKLMTPDERRRIAFHESGHAVVTAALGRPEDLHRVSIVARGKGLGQTMATDEADRVLLTVDEMEDQLAMAMGGVAAEEMRLGRSSTTSEDDIERASEIAREMVGRYGMSAAVGRVRLLSKYDAYLGGDTTVVDAVSPETMREFDQEVKRLTGVAEKRARDVLGDNEESLDRLASVLETEETLEGDALLNMLSSVIRPAKPSHNGSGSAARKSEVAAKPRW